MTEFHFAIIEQPPANASEQNVSIQTEFSCLPLMQQKDLQHLSHAGPWLVALDDAAFSRLNTPESDFPQEAIKGWLTSYLPIEPLSQHLSDALVAQGPDGQHLLLRSYAPSVLPALHARKDCSWHAAFFGPINSWWLLNGAEIQQYKGGGMTTLPTYQPITLDTELLLALALDRQALALLDELQRSAPQVFDSDCHGNRLRQVEQALAAARQTELTHPDDHSLFATLYLLEGHPPDHAPDWPIVMQMMSDQNVDFEYAITTARDSSQA